MEVKITEGAVIGVICQSPPGTKESGLLPTDFVPKTSFRSNDDVQGASSRLITIKKLAVLYGLKMSAIYAFIKTDPTFPYVNVGVKKKFLVDVIQFERWLMERTKKQKQEYFSIPSAVDLMKAFKPGVGK